MKRNFYLLLTTFFLSNYLIAQVPNSSIAHDQIVQGPCYIFATVAALESKAIQNGHPFNIDLYEWNLYSKDVLGSRSGNGDNMVKKTLANAEDHGIYERSAGETPQGISKLPNVNDPLAGIADFGCGSLKTGYYKMISPDPGCPDDDGKPFEVNSFIGLGTKYEYNPNGTGYVNVTNPNPLNMQGNLNQGRGLIAFFTNWKGTGRGHSVFIHGTAGRNANGKIKWEFKDSWPGAAGNKTDTLDITTCTNYYYLTGTISSNAPATCQATISGPGTVSGNTTYTLSGGNSSSVNWSISGNLTVVSSNSSSITVKPSACSLGAGTISVSYYDNLSSCSKSKNVSVSGASSQPSSIYVMSSSWNSSNQTCPNTTLELEVVDNNNPSYPQTTYDWSVSGATILSGNGTPTVFVKTSSNSGTTNLTFKVRAKNGNCLYSSWRTIYGTSSSSNCSGGIGGALSFNGNNHIIRFPELASQFDHDKEINYSIISIDGKIHQEGKFNVYNSEIDISKIPSQLMIIKIFDENGKFNQSTKFLKSKQ